MMKWAARESLIPASVAVEMNVVDGLRKGRTVARDPEPVRPVPESDVLAIRKFVSPVVSSMIQVHLLSGMRPSEVCRLRTCDIERRTSILEYRPPRHKTEHHGKQRVVFFGRRAQAELTPWLCDDQPEDPIFHPRMPWNYTMTNCESNGKRKFSLRRSIDPKLILR